MIFTVGEKLPGDFPSPTKQYPAHSYKQQISRGKGPGKGKREDLKYNVQEAGLIYDQVSEVRFLRITFQINNFIALHLILLTRDISFITELQVTLILSIFP